MTLAEALGRPRARQFNGAGRYWFVFLIALGVTAAYVIFKSAYYFPDGLRWELQIAALGAPAVWHPNRLVYNALAVATLRVLKLFGYDGRLFGAMQILNALVGGIGFLIMYSLLRRWRVTPWRSLAAAFAVAFSYGYWAFACNGENVIAALVGVLVVVWVASAVIWGDASCALCGGLGAAVALACLVHISNGLSFPVAVAAVICASRRVGEFIKRFAVTAGIFVGVLFVAYGVVAFGVLRLGGLAQVLRWSLGSAGAAQYYSPLTLGSVKMSAVAMMRDFVAVHWLKDVAARGWNPGAVALAAGAVTAGLLIAALAVLTAGASVRRRQGRLVVMVLTLIVPYAVFFLFRDVGGWDRWVVQAVGILIFIYAAAPPARAYSVALSVLPVVLFTVNFAGGIYPESKEELNEHLSFARYVGGLAGPSDVVVFSGVGGLGQGVYLEYFTKTRPLYIYDGSFAPEAFRRRLADAVKRGARVFVVDDRPISTFSFVGDRKAERYSVTGVVARRLLAGYDLQLYAVYRGPRYEPSRVWMLVPAGVP